ncbi:biotin synthase [Methanocaldococcus villosus KIN24-T80]|uniref:Biotin synthase n=1 Tax=Methanocaldococcus villosus KIN24-T80 TaxID=1069083 RepID=N6VZE7_9EURY|nr:biotin synthase BioB [Methanocaldococcus villosus]ENN96487.1 biotin synthase [Methanocaldococcus villosus KIN24-T80]
MNIEKAIELYNTLSTIDLLYLAYKKKTKKDIDLCAIINAKSGKCKENCIFCSQSIYHNTSIPIYKLKSKDEILEYALKYDGIVNRFSIVVSGKKVNDEEFNKIVETIELLKDETSLKICCSLGLIDKEKLRILKDLDVRIHNNLETNKDYFKNICTTHSYMDKVRVIKDAKSLNLEVCSGGIIGLGESYLDRIKLAFELKDLGVDSVPINILHPIKGTKAYDLLKRGVIKPLSVNEILKTIAIFKLILKDCEIRLAGGRLFLGDYQSYALLALDGLMVGDYLTTKGRNLKDDLKMIKDWELL